MIGTINLVIFMNIDVAPRGVNEFIRDNPVSVESLCQHVDFVASSACDRFVQQRQRHERQISRRKRRVENTPTLSNLNSGTCVSISHTSEIVRRAFVSVVVDSPLYIISLFRQQDDCVKYNEEDDVAAYCLPSFVIVGVQKAGTTSLSSWLGRHPQIRTTLFEQHFFEKINNVSLSWKSYLYQNDFLLSPSELRNNVVTMERTPNYIFFSNAARNMRLLMPDTKLVLILRDPTRRAYSAWQHHCRQLRYRFTDLGEIVRVKTGTGSQDLDCDAEHFEMYLLSHKEDLKTLPIVQRGMYSNQLNDWLREGFKPSQFLILFSEIVTREPFDAVRSVERLAHVSHYPYRSEAKQNERGFWTLPGIPTKSDTRRGYDRMSDNSRRLLSLYYKIPNVKLLKLLKSHVWADGQTFESFPDEWLLQ